MQQKLFHVSMEDYFGKNAEIKLPKAVEDLIAEGWYIKKVSSYGLSYENYSDGSAVILLLQKD